MAKVLKKHIEYVVSNIVGDEAIPLAWFLKNNENISEIELSEKFGVELNRTRSILYKLHHANLVKSNRQRDKENGWYTYFWSFRPEVVHNLIKDIKTNKIEELKLILDDETNTLRYICGNNCTQMDFEHATNMNYKCPECGEIMKQKRACKDYVKSLKTEIKGLEAELK